MNGDPSCSVGATAGTPGNHPALSMPISSSRDRPNESQTPAQSSARPPPTAAWSEPAADSTSTAMAASPSAPEPAKPKKNKNKHKKKHTKSGKNTAERTAGPRVAVETAAAGDGDEDFDAELAEISASMCFASRRTVMYDADTLAAAEAAAAAASSGSRSPANRSGGRGRGGGFDRLHTDGSDSRPTTAGGRSRSPRPGTAASGKRMATSHLSVSSARSMASSVSSYAGGSPNPDRTRVCMNMNWFHYETQMTTQLNMDGCVGRFHPKAKHITLDMVKQVVFEDMPFPARTPQVCRCVRSFELDDLLEATMQYFDIFFQHEKTRARLRSKETTFMPEILQLGRDEARLSKLRQDAQEVLSKSYVTFLLKNTPLVKKAMQAVDDRGGNKPIITPKLRPVVQDRRFFEIMHTYLVRVLWVAFGRSDIELLTGELGRLLRTDAFNINHRTSAAHFGRQRAQDSIDAWLFPGLEEMSDSATKFQRKRPATAVGFAGDRPPSAAEPAIERYMELINSNGSRGAARDKLRPSVYALANKCSPLLKTFLPSPQDTSSWLYEKGSPRPRRRPQTCPPTMMRTPHRGHSATAKHTAAAAAAERVESEEEDEEEGAAAAAAAAAEAGSQPSTPAPSSRPTSAAPIGGLQLGILGQPLSKYDKVTLMALITDKDTDKEQSQAAKEHAIHKKISLISSPRMHDTHRRMRQSVIDRVAKSATQYCTAPLATVSVAKMSRMLSEARLTNRKQSELFSRPLNSHLLSEVEEL